MDDEMERRVTYLRKKLKDKGFAEEVMANPVEVIERELGIEGDRGRELSLENEILFAILKNDDVVKAIRDLRDREKSGEIGKSYYTKQAIDCVLNILPEEVKRKIGSEAAEIGGLSPEALANVLVHVDVVVVVTKALVVNGMVGLEKSDLKKIAKAVARGGLW